MLLEELLLRGIDVNKKEKITTLKKSIQNECPNPKTEPKLKKYFLPMFLTAIDWSRDDLCDTLATIDVIR